MARNRPNHSHKRGRLPNSAPSDTRTLRRLPEYTGRQAAVVYGKAFIILEDEQKNTFIYKAGAWVPHSASIKE